MNFAHATAALVLGSTTLIATGAAHAQASVAPAPIEGTWLLQVAPPMGAPVFAAVASYSRPGIVIVSPDRLPPIPGVGMALGAGQGSWAATGPREYKQTHVEFRYDATGAVVGTVKLRGTLRLAADDRIEGVGQLQFCDALFENCASPSPLLATVTGRRLPAEAPLP